MSSERSGLITTRPPGLVDVLDRILDKGLVIAGDIKVSLANVELLTIQIRLLVCSIDKAEQIGLNWWRSDVNLSARPRTSGEETELSRRVAELERALKLSPPPEDTGAKKSAGPAKKKSASDKKSGGRSR